MATRNIKLTLQRTHQVHRDRDAQRIRIVASDGVGIDEELFRYRMIPLDPSGSSMIGQFDGICSPDDLDNIPENSATPGASPAWFRMNYVDLIVRAPATADELWAAIYKDITILKNSLDNRSDFSESSSYSIDSDFDSLPADELETSSSSSLFSESLGVSDNTREIVLVFNAIVEASGGFNLRATVSSATGLSDKIFRYMRHPLNPNDAARQDHFNGVCSPADIEDFPENAPFGYIDPKFFRLNYVDLVLETLEEAEAFREELVTEIEDLKASYDLIDTFDEVTVYWVGHA
jgi:hypothetical protein